MNLKKEMPSMYICTQNKKHYLSAMIGVTDYSADINFGALSTMTFKVQKMIYDTVQYKWIKNPCYNFIQEKNIIKTTDNDYYIRFQGRKPYSTYGYTSALINRPKYNMSYETNINLDEWQIQSEVELYDVGSESGYVWSVGCYFDDNGGFIDASDNMKKFYMRIACRDFFPVNNGDVISLRSKTSPEDDAVAYKYYIYYYTDADASTFIKKTELIQGDPIDRHYVNMAKITGDDDISSGYVRFYAESVKSTYDESDTNASWVSFYPVVGYVKIYSGERHCTYIGCNATEESLVPYKWWIIKEVNEETDGINSSKTVTAYSYEATLANKTFSLNSGTLPLFVPDTVVDRVNKGEWYIDVIDDVKIKCNQKMNRGLINQILDYLPNWEIGYISQHLLGTDTVNLKYRSFDALDNANIYAFLVNEIQSKYNCFVIFDTDLQTINLISTKDVCGLSSSSFLNWNNAIKLMNITNNDTQYVTALRVHTANDDYSIGLINPLGNNIIYNFESCKSQMNEVVEENGKRTLYEAIENILYPNTDLMIEYKNYAIDLVKTNMKIIKQESIVATALSNYRAKADTINIYLQNDYKDSTIPSGYYIADAPRSYTSMKSGIYQPVSGYSNYHSQSLYSQLCDLAYAYEQSRNKLSDYHTHYQNVYKTMKNIAKVASINYREIVTAELSNSETAELTSSEVKALDYFISEGNWQNESAIFSETYSVDDIIDTLCSVYNDAKEDLDNIYSKPIYDFKATLINILAVKEMVNNIKDIYLGNSLFIKKDDGWISPILLSIHINYDDPKDFSMSFSTDYKRRPLELRFSDLFSTIERTTIETPVYTFNN